MVYLITIMFKSCQARDILSHPWLYLVISMLYLVTPKFMSCHKHVYISSHLCIYLVIPVMSCDSHVYILSHPCLCLVTSMLDIVTPMLYYTHKHTHRHRHTNTHSPSHTHTRHPYPAPNMHTSTPSSYRVHKTLPPTSHNSLSRTTRDGRFFKNSPSEYSDRIIYVYSRVVQSSGADSHQGNHYTEEYRTIH